MKLHLTLLFPLTQGWIKLCRQSAGLQLLLPLPLAITAEGPQGHEMSAIGQVRHLCGHEVTNTLLCNAGGEMAEWTHVWSSSVYVRQKYMCLNVLVTHSVTHRQ